MRIHPDFRRARRRWSDAPIIVKGQLAIALPVLTLLASSGLVIHADSQRSQANRQREAAEQVAVAVEQVRTASRAAEYAASAFLNDRTPTRLTAVRSAQVKWEKAVDVVEAAALVEPDAALQAQVKELSSSTDDLVVITGELFALTETDPAARPLEARAGAANSRFEAAIQAISDHAASRARAYAGAFDTSSATTNRLILISALVGATAAVAAMVLLTLALRRRVIHLQENSAALGEGRPLRALDASADELGRLGRGLEDAADVLRQRQQALQDAAETLGRNEQRLSLALESSAMGTWDVDLMTGVSTWDDQTERDHGLEPGTFGGTFDAWLDLVHPEDRAAVMTAGSEAIASGGRWSTEYRTVVNDRVRWIGTTGQALLGQDGAPIRLVGISIDITGRKSYEQNLRAAIVEAERANSVKNEFLSRVSHELRTPLNAILGFGQLLEMDELTTGQAESVAEVLRGGRHLLALVDDVLDISRIESDNLPLSIEPVAVAEVVSETVSMVGSTAQQLGITVQVRWTTPSDVHVRADRRRLKQVLVNLASNAVKYNRSGGEVTVLCSAPEPGIVRIAVHDTGNGIPADRLDQLFTPFDRLGAEHTEVDGTGIGLALSQRLAEMMGTRLVVGSEVGVGTTFSLDLSSVADPVTTAQRTGDSGLVSADGPGGTVLYVEDNPSNFTLVQRLLERRPGIRLLSARTGAVALSIAERVPVDVILLDLHLPDIPGAEVLSRLRKLPRTASTPIVVVSADVTPGQMQRLRDNGADGFLGKPIDLGEFVEMLDGHLAAAVPS